jgi:hypothetical protein
MIGMVLRTQCKGFAEEGSGVIDVLRIISTIAFKARIRKIGESRSVIWMANWTLIQNQLKMLHSSVQVRDRLARHVFGQLRVTCICILSNFAVYKGL